MLTSLAAAAWRIEVLDDQELRLRRHRPATRPENGDGAFVVPVVDHVLEEVGVCARGGPRRKNRRRRSCTGHPELGRASGQAQKHTWVRFQHPPPFSRSRRFGPPAPREPCVARAKFRAECQHLSASPRDGGVTARNALQDVNKCKQGGRAAASGRRGGTRRRFAGDRGRGASPPIPTSRPPPDGPFQHLLPREAKTTRRRGKVCEEIFTFCSFAKSPPLSP